jgi:upstream-binding transcription factor
MTSTINNKNNIDTIVSETIKTIIPNFLRKVLKSNKKALDSSLQILEKDNEFHNSLKTLVETNIPKPVVKVVRNKISKPKDIDAPKKPKSAYLIFCQENREKIKEENPDIQPKEILSKLGSLWQTIKNEPGSKKYIKKAVEDKTRYDSEISEYSPSEEYNKVMEEYKDNPENFEKKTKTKKTKKEKKVVDPNKPKKPQTIFFKYSKEMRDKVKEEHPEMKTDEIAKELGRRWKNEVSDEEKDEYKNLFKTEMLEYKRLMEQYKPLNSEDEDEKVEKKVDKVEKKVDKVEKKVDKEVKKVEKKVDKKVEKKVDKKVEKKVDKEVKKVDKEVEDSDDDIVEDSDDDNSIHSENIVDDSDDEIMSD